MCRAGFTAGWTVAVGSLAAIGGAASATMAVAAHSRAPTPAPRRALDVLPFPGTPDAAPQTNIDFPAVAPGQITRVSVVGSASGLHTGRLSAQPAGQGTAFRPDRPFSQGERVTVTAAFRSATAATASGAPGQKQVSFSFSVARFATVAASAQPAIPGGQRRASVEAGSSKTHSFVTEPGFHVPWIIRSGKDTDTSQGRIFLTTQNFGQSAAYMVNGKGELQWWHPAQSAPGFGGKAARNARVETYQGHRVIIFWQGNYVCPPCGGRGEGVMLNSSYKTIHTITAGDGYAKQGADFHEFTLGHEGKEATAFVQIWSPVHANLTAVGGPANGMVYDWIIQEIDVATNKVIWEWHAYGHVPLRDSYAGCCYPGKPWDFFHLNSIQQLPSGRILISARHTWAVYSIDKKSGKIAWELGGKHSSFRMGRGTRFYWQHDATLYGHGLLTVFDDGASPQKEPQSRALEIRLRNHRATLIHAFTHKPPVVANNEGSMQLLPNHNVFVGWGAGNPLVPSAGTHYFSEYTPSGRQIFSDGFIRPIESYRAYRMPWTGLPLWAPRIAVRRTSTKNRFSVYVSWSGATQVQRWRVLAGPGRTGPFKPLRTAAWSSFETRIPVSTHAAYFEVEALGRNGKLLAHGTSAVVAAP
jgi:hypothetical protein